MVHAVIEIGFHIFGVRQVLHDAKATFKSAKEAASMTWVVIELLVPIGADVVHIEHGLYLTNAAESTSAYGAAKLIALGVVIIYLFQVWGQISWCILKWLWIVCHTDSSILVACLCFAISSISVFAARSDLLFVSLHPIELGLLILLLLFDSIVLNILASAIGIE